jgi:2'-5' RNA ligase
MRLFLAIDLGDEVLAAAAGIASELRRRIPDAAGAKLTWVSPDRMHVTIRFIGEVTAATAEQIGVALGPPLAGSPFDVIWQGLGAFPGRRRPRVLICHATTGLDALRALEREVAARLATLGIPREQRPYTPHLTLARVREPGRMRPDEMFRGLEHERLGTSYVDAITLFESHLSPKGPAYVPLQRTALRVGGSEDPPYKDTRDRP